MSVYRVNEMVTLQRLWRLLSVFSGPYSAYLSETVQQFSASQRRFSEHKRNTEFQPHQLSGMIRFLVGVEV